MPKFTGSATPMPLCSRVAEPEPVGSGPFWLDPESKNFHQIRNPIRIWILSVLWQCEVVKAREKYLKNRAFAHFQVNFSIFSDKNHHSNIIRNMFDVKEIYIFELILGKCQ